MANNQTGIGNIYVNVSAVESHSKNDYFEPVINKQGNNEKIFRKIRAYYEQKKGSNFKLFGRHKRPQH